VERKTDEGASDIAIWEWLEKLVMTLGPEGTSSDESDVDEETGTEILYVKSLDWRRSCEKEMDIVDRQRRADRELFSNKGSKPTPRLRKQSRGNTRRKPPLEKPKALFDRKYLENHRNERSLKFSGEKMTWLNIRSSGWKK
jgi:hypothetical protein